MHIEYTHHTEKIFTVVIQMFGGRKLGSNVIRIKSTTRWNHNAEIQDHCTDGTN